MTINIAPSITIATKTPPPPQPLPSSSQQQQPSSPPVSLPSSPRNNPPSSIILQQATPPPEQQQPSTLTSHFVQALHDYLPINAPADEAVLCLFFRKGAIIEVFNRDSSGWWDGASNGVRGWFPSNYVGRIGEATRDSADFEDEASQQQWETWRNMVHHHHEDNATAADATPPAESNKKDSKASLPPPPPPKQQEPSLNRVQLARALLNQGRQNESSVPSSSSNHLHEGGGDEDDEDEDEELATQPRWEILMDDVAKQVSELVTMMDTTKKSTTIDDVQMHIFQVVSSIRAVLTAANAVNNDAPLLKTYPDLSRQRKIILSTLSKLVLKGKSSSHHNAKTTDAIATLANQLLMELEVFEEHLRNVPDLTTSTTSVTLSSYGTPVGSSSPRSSVDGGASTAKATVIDPKPILQNLVTHQATIDELVGTLVSTIEKYLEHRQRASELLETTRKTIEAIRTFLTVVEHVCSHVGDLDYHASTSAPSLVSEDPQLVALVLSKEAVYSAINHLVTAVRALAGPGLHNQLANSSSHEEVITDGKRASGEKDGGGGEEEEEQELKGLRQCCENVIRTTNECAARVRVCLGVAAATMEDEEGDQRQQQQQTLIGLGRKMPSLHVLEQHQYDEQDVESLAITSSSNASQQQKHESTQTTSSSTGSSLWRASADSSCTSMTTPEIMTPIHDQVPLPPLPPPKNQYDQLRGLAATKTNDQKSPRSSTKQQQQDPSSSSIRHTSSWLSMNGIDRGLQNSEHGKQEAWFLRQRTFSEDEMIFNSEGQVMGATVKALVEKLTQHEKSPELLFLRAFFYNFRLFTTPAAFLDMLIERFELEPPMENMSEEDLSLWTNRVLLPVRLRVYNVIKIWLETFFCYETDGSTEQTLIEFVMGPMNKAMASPAKRMMELVRKRFTTKTHPGTVRKLSYSNDAAAALAARPTMLLNNTKNNNSNSSNGTNTLHLHGTAASLFSTLALFEDHSAPSSESATAAAAPPPSITRSLKNTLRKAMAQGVLSSVPINEFDPIELARQLTLMESQLFCQIEAKEMIGQEFKKKVGSSIAVHVKAMIQRSTQITSWVADTILRESDVKKRAQMIKMWIKVGDNCLQLRNYNTLMAIRSALDSTSIARLKRTWEIVSAKYKAMYDPIYRATDSQRNFAEYRRRLRDAVAPCLPFLGVYLTDMTFIDDGNANHRTAPNTGAQLINFDKYVKTTRILNEIDQFQIPYKLVEVEEIQRYLLQCLETVEKNDQVFYTRSLQLEPREEDFDIKSFISNLA